MQAECWIAISSCLPLPSLFRSRVNVFIAESNAEMSGPMFEYFKRRNVVDEAGKTGLAGVRVFGATDTVHAWLRRGEYYLQNAEGGRQKGCLRLAAKCFDKAGQVKRRDFALAYLSFVEMEEQDISSKKRKQSEFREQLYGIHKQLLDAREVGFLNKAALCLLRAGDHDEESARLFELYAR